MEKNRILIVDDEKLISWSLASMLSKQGYQVATAASGREAMQAFADFRPEMVMLDILLPDTSGLELLKRFKGANERLHVMMMTAYANADSAVQALQDGAEEFFGKPFQLEAVKQVVEETFERDRIRKEMEGVKEDPRPEPGRQGATLRKKGGQDRLVGNSRKMIEVFKMIKACSQADAKTVLVTGESGTGKELVARAVHHHSARAGSPFVEINCASIPENLLENELFGHERGAYTDASMARKGLFEMARGGSLFLDEIGDMPLAMQAKVLKVIENRRFRRLGGEADVVADVRIIAATHQDLPGMVKEGSFRSDLFFRLNVMNVRLPPLRERREDIEPLAQYFVEVLNGEYGRKVSGIAPETLSCLREYDWPGNVRELRNCIERLLVMEREEFLTPQHLPAEIRRPPEEGARELSAVATSEFAGEHIALPATGISLEELEKRLIVLALQKAGGNQSKAARFLKTSRDTLRYRMKKFGLSEGTEPPAGCERLVQSRN